jgi:uncharacterized protein YcbX
MAKVGAIYRYPVKGFSPERLIGAVLHAGSCFPCDRLYAVEDGPSGFDPAAPAHISKMKFTVLAKIPAVAKARTAYDEATGVFTARAEGRPDFAGDLRGAEGRHGFEAWLADLLGDEAQGPLRVVEGPGDHRFMDSRSGHVSIVNLASLRDLADKLGRPIDPLRFRANLYVEGWPAWVENDWIGPDAAGGPGPGGGAQAHRPLRRHPCRPGHRRARHRPGEGPVRPLRPHVLRRLSEGGGERGGGRGG